MFALASILEAIFLWLAFRGDLRLHVIEAISLLLLYNLMFVLPLIVLFVAAYFGVSARSMAKLASRHAATIKLVMSFVFIGFTLYALTAFGWLFVMKHLKLATISVLYSVSMVVLLTAVGVVFFQESLNTYEIAGLVMALASLVLLVRFA